MKSYEKALADARGKATDIARETRDAVNKDVDAESHKLDEALSKKIAAADPRSPPARPEALEAVEDIAANSAAEIVAALGGGKVTKAAIAKVDGIIRHEHAPVVLAAGLAIDATFFALVALIIFLGIVF